MVTVADWIVVGRSPGTRNTPLRPGFWLAMYCALPTNALMSRGPVTGLPSAEQVSPTLWTLHTLVAQTSFTSLASATKSGRPTG